MSINWFDTRLRQGDHVGIFMYYIVKDGIFGTVWFENINVIVITINVKLGASNFMVFFVKIW